MIRDRVRRAQKCSCASTEQNFASARPPKPRRDPIRRAAPREEGRALHIYFGLAPSSSRRSKEQCNVSGANHQRAGERCWGTAF